MYDNIEYLYDTLNLSIEEICYELNLPYEYVYSSIIRGE